MKAPLSGEKNLGTDSAGLIDESVHFKAGDTTHPNFKTKSKPVL